MKVIVYVEGSSDQKALQALLKPIIDVGRSRGTGISFLPLGGKAKILDDVPRRAAGQLHQHAKDWVFALPDLYPMASYDNGPYRHRTFAELCQVLQGRFRARADKIRLPDAVRRQFRVHCLKHDLEALVLAAPGKLRDRLDTADALQGRWRQPVEEQNDDKPPKRIVEDLFEKYCKRRYRDTTDAVWVLERASLEAIEAVCRECFAPFVHELRALANGQDPDTAVTAKRGK